MFYSYTLTVPAGTPVTAPVIVLMPLDYGMVHQIEVGFPPGCAGLVHVAIWHCEHQAFPSNPDGDFAWDDYNIIIRNEAYPIDVKPYLFTLRGWAPSAALAHTVTCRIGLRLPDLNRPGSWLSRILKGDVYAT